MTLEGAFIELMAFLLNSKHYKQIMTSIDKLRHINQNNKSIFQTMLVQTKELFIKSIKSVESFLDQTRSFVVTENTICFLKSFHYISSL